MVEGKWVGCKVAAEHAEVGRGKGLLLCGRDRFTRRNVDTYLHLENGVNREMPGIPRPLKGGQRLRWDKFLAVCGIKRVDVALL